VHSLFIPSPHLSHILKSWFRMGIGVCDNSGERAAMESKLKKLEAKVTSERQAQVAFEKECKKLQSQVGVLILEEKAVRWLRVYVLSTGEGLN